MNSYFSGNIPLHLWFHVDEVRIFGLRLVVNISCFLVSTWRFQLDDSSKFCLGICVVPGKHILSLAPAVTEIFSIEKTDLLLWFQLLEAAISQLN